MKMKWILGLILISILPATVFAKVPELVFSGTHGEDIIFGVLQRQGAKLNLSAFRTDPAPGVVGFTTVAQTDAGSDTFNVFYTYTNPANNRPSLARHTYNISNITDGSSNTILLTETKRYPAALGDYDISFFRTILPYIESSPFAQREDPFFRALNPSSNPVGPNKKLFNIPSGSSSVRTNFSEDGTTGSTAFFLQNIGPSFFTYICPSDAPPKVESVNRFGTQNQIIDFQWSNLHSNGFYSFIYREISRTGNQFQTFVGSRQFQAGRPVGNITTVNPRTNLSGPGTESYANAFFGQVATAPDGNWFFWASYPAGCKSGEWWSRCYNPQSGNYCGGKSKIFGNCNIALADGSVRTIRSVDVTQYLVNR